MLYQVLLLVVVLGTFVHGETSLDEAFAKLRYNRKLLSAEIEPEAVEKSSAEIRSEAQKATLAKFFNEEERNLRQEKTKYLPSEYTNFCGITILNAKDKSLLYRSDDPATYFSEFVINNGKQGIKNNNRKYNCMFIGLYEPNKNIHDTITNVPAQDVHTKRIILSNGNIITSKHSYATDARTAISLDTENPKVNFDTQEIDIFEFVDASPESNIFYSIIDKYQIFTILDTISIGEFHDKNFIQGNTVFGIDYNDNKVFGKKIIKKLIIDIKNHGGYKIPQDIIQTNVYRYKTKRYVKFIKTIISETTDTIMNLKKNIESLDITINELVIEIENFQLIIGTLNSEKREKGKENELLVQKLEKQKHSFEVTITKMTTHRVDLEEVLADQEQYIEQLQRNLRVAEEQATTETLRFNKEIRARDEQLEQTHSTKRSNILHQARSEFTEFEERTVKELSSSQQAKLQEEMATR